MEILARLDANGAVELYYETQLRRQIVQEHLDTGD